MSTVNLDERIPNNVDLSSDRRLQRAFEQWQPEFLSWWKEVGPVGFQASDAYLRTAVSVEAGGWAHFDYVRMPEYRWGIFLEPAVADQKIGFGDHLGEPVWQDVPGEHRNALRRLIVTQGDTEPASVEQQRRLGRSCPSLYDLRNLFQVNVEEGRHLWAMVYLLHRYFGRDGREEAQELLRRRSGDSDKPRILEAFNYPIDDWLSFYMFTTFTDRDGKFQLMSLAESGFDPLARTCRFMLTEEAHHMFVGETGIARIAQRSVELMREGKEPRACGAIDIPTVQRYLNLWYSASLDLFGAEVSTNAAGYFAAGLKGRPKEQQQFTDHRLMEGAARIEVFENGSLAEKDVPARLAVNRTVREAYTADCQKVIERWNRHLESAGMKLELPSVRFNRKVGTYAGGRFDTSGNLLGEEEFAHRSPDLLPSSADSEYVRSLMARPVLAAGAFANWIAPPSRGIDGKPLDFEYVRYNEQ